MNTHISLPITLAILGHALVSQGYTFAGWITISVAIVISMVLIGIEEHLS